MAPTVKKIGGVVGKEDKQRIDEYLSEVRDLERKVAIMRPEVGSKQCGLSLDERPRSSHQRFDDHIRVLS